MKLATVKIDKLTPAEYNPREQTEQAAAHLKDSLTRFGMVEPIVVNSAPARRNIIIGGHFRVKVWKEMGHREIDVVFVNIPDLNREKELNIRLNKNTGRFSLDLLANFEKNLLADIGFEPGELDRIFGPKKGKTDPDEAPELPKVARTRPGDIYTLGGHRILCGDSTNLQAVRRVMDREQADMVFTDPPYNVDYSGCGKDTKKKIENDNLSQPAFKAFLTRAFENYREILKKNGGMYVCYASRTHREFEDSLNAANFEVRNQIIWVKLVASMGWGDYRWKHEPILYCFQAKNSVNFYGDRKQYTQWDEEKNDADLLAMFKRMIKKEEDGNSTVWRFNREYNYKHPTQKPVAMIEKALLNSSQRGNIVADLFLGSGSTLLACERTDRRCYGMELSPYYCDVVVDRWQQFTGKKAELARRK